MTDEMNEQMSKILNDLTEGITQVTDMKCELEYAISKLPKSRSKKTIAETETESEESSNTENHEC